MCFSARKGFFSPIIRFCYGCVLFLVGLPAGILHAQIQPNIVFIYTDDLGYASIGTYGQRHRELEGLPAMATPSIDSLAARGMQFTDHYAASPTCAPSRASLMTGYHTGHTNIRANRGYNPGNEPLDSIPTIANALQLAGYRTIAIGKWGLGGEANQQFEAHPLRRGFDEFFGVLDQTQCHQQYLDRITSLNPNGEIWQDYTRIRPGIDVPETYANNLFGQRALEVINDRYDEGPFFLYLSLTTPHARMESPPSGVALVIDTTDWPEEEKLYASMVSSIDHQLGRIMRALDSLGIADQTLLLFSSDNGPHDEAGNLGTTDPHDWEFFDENAPFRGRKRQLLEGGIRVPLIAAWPGVIAAGSQSNLPCAAWDFFPTLTDLAGAVAPPNLDGISFAPTLTGVGLQQRHFALYWEFDDLFFRQAVRMGSWKALRNGETANVQLYNLATDSSETFDLARNFPDKAAKMADYMLCLREPSADFSSPVDGWPKPDCDFFALDLVEPAPDSRLVQPDLVPITLVMFAAAGDDSTVNLRVFELIDSTGERVEWPAELSDDGFWRCTWIPSDYGYHQFILSAVRGDSAVLEQTFGFEIGQCPLVRLSQTAWSVVGTDSEETSGAPNQARRAIDGDLSTFWHTEWLAADPPHPHYIEIDLGRNYRVGGMDYVPRPGPSENGVIADHALFLRTADSTEYLQVAAGNWPWPGQPFTRPLRFPTQIARYFRLEAYSEINGGPWASAAELPIYVDSCWVSPDTIIDPPIGIETGFGSSAFWLAYPNPVERGGWVVVGGGSVGGSGGAAGSGLGAEPGGAAGSGLAVGPGAGPGAAGGSRAAGSSGSGVGPAAEPGPTPAQRLTPTEWSWCGVGGDCQSAQVEPFGNRIRVRAPQVPGVWGLRGVGGVLLRVIVL